MRKILVLVILVFVAIGALLGMAFIGVIPLGEPILKVELNPSPPARVRPGGHFPMGVGIVNNAWLLATARDVQADVHAPQGFTISRTNTNECEMNFGTLLGGESRNDTVTITVGTDVPHGNYNITITVFGGNVPTKTLTPQVFVELPT